MDTGKPLDIGRINVSGETALIKFRHKGLDLKNKKWSFTIKKNDYLDIKKLSSINGTKLLNINVVKGLVKITETSAWELEVDEIEDRTK